MKFESLITDIHLWGFMVLILSLIVTYKIIPKIIWVVTEKELIDHPEDRSSHKVSTPTMAGVAFFLTLMISQYFLHYWDSEDIGVSLVASVTIIFAIALKDDLVLATPKAKLMGEIVAISFILVHPSFTLNSLSGFMGVESIPFGLNYVFSLLMMLTIINAYNLIDGVDGLAASIGIVIFLIYGLIFYYLKIYFYVLLCASLIGILMAFLRYNLSHKKKIFMGDTGSLIIGFCIGFLSLKFLNVNSEGLRQFSFLAENKLIILAAILFVPLFDMFRVMGIRILNKKSPFFPDRNHIHHILLDKGFPHVKVAIMLSIGGFWIVLLFVYLSSLFTSFQMFAILGMFFTLMLGIFNILRRDNIKKGKTISKLKTYKVFKKVG